MNDLLAFGGPLNERIIPVRPGQDVVLAPVPTRMSYMLEPIDEATSYAAMGRTVRYNVQQFAYHDTRYCDHHAHTERCAVFGQCLIVDGYPKQRIIDGLNTLLFICFALHS